MKTKLLMIGLVLATVALASPDQNIVVRKNTKVIHGYPMNGYSVNLKGEPTDIKQFWIDFLKTDYHVKLKETEGMYKADEVFLNDIHEGKATVYTIFREHEDKKGMELTFILDKEQKVYTETKEYTVERKKTEQLLTRFAKKYYSRNYDVYFKSLRKDMVLTKKEIDKINKTIFKLKEKYSKQYLYLGQLTEEDKVIYDQIELLKGQFEELVKKFEKLNGEFKEAKAFQSSI